MFKKKKSPFDPIYKRRPAQALEEAFDDKSLAFSFIFTLMLIYAIIAVLAAIGVFKDPYFAPLSACASLVVLLVLFRKYKHLKNIGFGLKGERHTAFWLDELREDGFKVIHDFQLEKGNIDHIVIGPQGVFTIETKTRTFPENKSGGFEKKIVVDKEKFTFANGSFETAPLIQAKAQANELAQILRESTGQSIPVTPIVAIPGSFVTYAVPQKKCPVRVYNPKGFRSHAPTLPAVLKEDVWRSAHTNLRQLEEIKERNTP